MRPYKAPRLAVIEPQTPPERPCTRCMLDAARSGEQPIAATLATVVCTARDGLQWYACDKPEHRAEYDDASIPAAVVMPIAEWWTSVAASLAAKRTLDDA